MTAPKSVKAGRRACLLVGVITTLAELRLARRMSQPPDLFELRLDHLVRVQNELARHLANWRAAIIITARHPAEGGANNLSPQLRRELLMRFLPHARYVDVELRSVRALRLVLETARRRRVGRIVSFHHLASTPSPRSLHAKALAAASYRADIFKVATRTDTPAQLARLISFASSQDARLPLSVMGIGKLGGISRVALAGSGSVLTYASLGEKRVEGQLTVGQLRKALEIFT